MLPRPDAVRVIGTEERMHIEVVRSRTLWFDDGTPVRAASAIAPFAGGWLVAQDDATHAAWCLPSGIERVRLFPPVEGHDTFSPAAGTKKLKPDVEAAVAVRVGGGRGVLALGSGSSPARMRAALVTESDTEVPDVSVADLAVVYTAIGDRLGIDLAEVNLEGACVLGEVFRWFNRGNLAGGVPSASIDLDLDALLRVFAGAGCDEVVASLRNVRTYDLGDVDGVGLTVTDAVALPDGSVVVSAAAEDTPNAIDDGPVVGAALALVDDDGVRASVRFPLVDGQVPKVEGLLLLDHGPDESTLVVVVDDDDPDRPSAEHTVRVRWR